MTNSAPTGSGEHILDWKVPISTPTGVREVTDLTDLDTGFGNYLVNTLHGCTIQGDHKRDRNAKAFFARPVNEQIFKGHFTEPKEFLQQLRATMKNRKSERTAPVTPPGNTPPTSLVPGVREDPFKDLNFEALPAIYFHRNIGYATAPAGDHKPVTGAWEVDDGTGKTTADVDTSPVTVSYSVYVLAWDLASIGRISTAITLFLTHNASKFEYVSQLKNARLTLNARINDRRTVIWEDMSQPAQEDRLMVLGAQFELTAEVLQARDITFRDVTIFMNDGIPMFCGGDR